jgi:hypothetical protein
MSSQILMESSQESSKYIGLSLALLSGVLIGISFIITKKGLQESHDNSTTAGEGYDYLKSPMWWAGTVY